MGSVLAISSQILAVLLVCVSGERDFTLTTATYRDVQISVKPTAFYRRIAVDRNVEDQKPTSSDIFHTTNTTRRKDRGADIWNWDFWCQQQPKIGNCANKLQKYYYNQQLDQCLTFTYSGCDANKNNFDTLLDCERHCKGAAFMVLKDVDQSTVCTLQPNAGLCVALFDRYYYDVNKEKCEVFSYGGCGGNKNRFPTEFKCRNKCGKMTKTLKN